MKTCTVCKQPKDLGCFYANKRSADGKGYRCKTCDDEARTRSRAKSPGTKFGYRRRTLMSKYGITQDLYDDILKAQGGGCRICKTTNPCGEGNKTNRLAFFAVDHCHATNRVRGLLCNLCNRGLGFFKDNTRLLKEAANYLDSYS